MVTKELKQIWNSAVAVNIVVATIAVAILEQQQRKFRAGYLQNCDLQFPNLTYTRLRLSFTLIFNYKRSTHHKEWRRAVTQGEKHKETKEKQDSRERLKATQEEKLQRSIGSSIFLILLLFSCFLFIHGDVFHGRNFVLYFSFANHELNLFVVE